MGYKQVNDRIITVRLTGQAKNITLIQGYAPSSASTEEGLEEFLRNTTKGNRQQEETRHPDHRRRLQC